MHHRTGALALALAAAAPAAAGLVACSGPSEKAPLPAAQPPVTLACSPAEIVSVRGSGEPPGGNAMMSGVIGGVQAARPGTTVYHVRYPATFDFATSSPAGAADLVAHLRAQSAACPDQRFVFVAHSQGNIVLHLAYQHLPAELGNRVVGIVGYGSPYFKADSPDVAGTGKRANGTYTQRHPVVWQAKTRDYCNAQDIVCGAGTSIPTHYAYHQYDADAAAFLAAKL